MATIELWCKSGRHFYDREVGRGRRPINCPDHQPVKTDLTVAVEASETFTCRKCSHAFSRPVGSRGPKPKYCLACKPQKAAEASTEAPTAGGKRILWCENGKHDWERESKRGAPPKNCPTHQTTIKAAPASFRPRSADELRADGYFVDKESAYVLAFICAAVNSGRDYTSLPSSYADRYRYILRQNRISAAQIADMPVVEVA